jgi:hypothetical protein
MKAGLFCVYESRLQYQVFIPTAHQFFQIRPARQPQCYTLLMLRVTMRQCRPARSSHILGALFPKSLIVQSVFCLLRVTVLVPMFGGGTLTRRKSRCPGVSGREGRLAGESRRYADQSRVMQVADVEAGHGADRLPQSVACIRRNFARQKYAYENRQR